MDDDDLPADALSAFQADPAGYMRRCRERASRVVEMDAEDRARLRSRKYSPRLPARPDVERTW